MTVLQNPSHPGEVLAELYLTPLGMSAITLAKRLNVPRTRIERVVKGETVLSVDTAMRLSKFFGTTAEYWINLQRAHDLARARETIDLSGITPLAATSDSAAAGLPCNGRMRCGANAQATRPGTSGQDSTQTLWA